ncbi:hypothetical protein OG799_07090 [Micromonospora sp. NBC_00898]|uniref:hypothetical protein n=1 Tax=Micromonospora sp. NBC_00898 TaxID=2975981 RepID=UPI003864AAE1|nr:hypothetical protein OG799_07090 [Micromonospora sp. NBC_00898]
MGEELLTRVPFAVVLASYCIEFHERNLCAKCNDSGCPRLDDATFTLDRYRADGLERYRLRRAQ